MLAAGSRRGRPRAATTPSTRSAEALDAHAERFRTDGRRPAPARPGPGSPGPPPRTTPRSARAAAASPGRSPSPPRTSAAPSPWREKWRCDDAHARPVALRGEADIDEARPRRVGLRHPLRADLPREGDPRGRLAGHDAAPVAAEPVRPGLVSSGRPRAARSRSRWSTRAPTCTPAATTPSCPREGREGRLGRGGHGDLCGSCVGKLVA